LQLYQTPLWVLKKHGIMPNMPQDCKNFFSLFNKKIVYPQIS